MLGTQQSAVLFSNKTTRLSPSSVLYLRQHSHELGHIPAGVVSTQLLCSQLKMNTGCDFMVQLSITASGRDIPPFTLHHTFLLPHASPGTHLPCSRANLERKNYHFLLRICFCYILKPGECQGWCKGRGRSYIALSVADQLSWLGKWALIPASRGPANLFFLVCWIQINRQFKPSFIVDLISRKPISVCLQRQVVALGLLTTVIHQQAAKQFP